MDFLRQMIYTLFCRNFCRLLCMLLLLAARSFLWTGFQLATLNPQPQKRLLLIFSPSMVYIVAYSIAWQKKCTYCRILMLIKLHGSYWRFVFLHLTGLESTAINFISYTSSFKLYFLSLLAFWQCLNLQGADGILVPGGFGDRGVQGKLLAAKYAREKKIPFLGICLGMQVAVIEFARSVLGLQDANSTEFDPDTKNPCVIFMPEVCILCF